jgi:hypothetical protein
MALAEVLTIAGRHEDAAEMLRRAHARYMANGVAVGVRRAEAALAALVSAEAHR